MQTVLAAFDDEQTARRAMDELVATGFARSDVHLQSGSLPGESRPASASGNSVMSAVGHFFSHLFESEKDHAGVYSEAVRRGSTVVAVDADSDTEVARARELLQKYGTVNLEDRAARWKSEGWTGFDANAGMMTDEQRASAREAIPVVEEELHIGKRAVDVGGLRVIKRMNETPVSEVINLQQQNATVQRTPMDRPATEGDFQNFKDGTFEVRETAEEAVIGKTARVVEEVAVGTTVTNRQEQVSDRVRNTEVDVERLPPENGQPAIRPRSRN